MSADVTRFLVRAVAAAAFRCSVVAAGAGCGTAALAAPMTVLVPPNPPPDWYASRASLPLPSLALAANEEPTTPASAPGDRSAKQGEAPEAEALKPAWLEPFTFEISYTLASDYVSRGVTYTDYEDEGREKPNHQMATALGVDIAALLGRAPGSLGTFTFGTWFQWFSAQEHIDPEKGQRELQEVDYVLEWSCEIQPIATMLILGYAFYTIPSDTATNTQEWYFRLEHNDAWMWKWLWPNNNAAVLKPYLAGYYDTDYACGAMWFDAGISHDFEVVENVTLTPSFDLGIDHRWLGPILRVDDGATRLATLRYGLTLSYDLTTLLRLDKLHAGSVVLSGFIYYSDALGTAERTHTIGDQVFGGMSVSWSF